MDDLILRHLRGEANDVEEHRLAKWRAESAGNETRYRETRALWEGLGRLETPRARRRPDAGALIGEAERRRARTRARGSATALLGSPRVRFGLAAAATVVLASAGLRVWQARQSTGFTLTPVESSVGMGRVAAHTLSDGTFVRAAEGARLEFPDSPGRREVNLDGAAFFAVAAGNTPFVVRAGSGEVRVRGTRFEVRTEGGSLRVVVVGGVVEVATPGGAAVLGAGQVATVRGDGRPEVTAVADVWALLDWPGGLLAFQGTSLRDVAVQLRHQFGVDVAIGDSAVAERRVTGSFQEASLDEVFGAVCAVTGIRCTRQGNTFVMGEVP